MKLTIKDLSTSVELDHTAMGGVLGGNGTNSAVQGIGEGQQVNAPVANESFFGAGSSTNLDVHVDAHQRASNDSYQYNGDSFGLFLTPFLRRS